MVFFSVVYTEPDPTTYAGVGASFKGWPEDIKLMTGDPTADMVALQLIVLRMGLGELVMESSSVNHFMMDGGEMRDESPTDEDIERAKPIARRWWGANHERFGLEALPPQTSG